MTGQNFMDEVDCGSFFDHIEDLIEFPPENETALNSVNCDDCPSIWTNNSAELSPSGPIFPVITAYSACHLSEELAVPYEDIVQLEWLSTFVEDSFSDGGMTLNKENISFKQDSSVSRNQFQTSSPVSVLESSSSSSSSSSFSGGKTFPFSPPTTHRGTQRARSKRPRPATFNPRPAIQLLSPNTPFTDTPRPLNVLVFSSESEIVWGTGSVKAVPKPCGPEQKKKKKMKRSVPLGPVEENRNPAPQHGVRKCMHCEITKTPQWRAGPMGPKTLCNACGVRYKSGRLFPEYRPAASPTFVAALHSNSHKKVVEMRTKCSEKTTMVESSRPVPELEPEFIPSSNSPVNFM